MVHNEKQIVIGVAVFGLVSDEQAWMPGFIIVWTVESIVFYFAKFVVCFWIICQLWIWRLFVFALPPLWSKNIFLNLCPLRCGALLLNFPPPPRRLKMHASGMTNPPYQYFWFFTIGAKSKEYGTILYSFRLPFLCCCGTTFVLKLGRVSWIPYPSLQDFVLGERTVFDGSTGG